jgi:farnesyl diphosphate synthase
LTSESSGHCSRADSKQRKLLEENYGKHDEEKVSKVKELFAGLQLEAAFKTYEEESYAEIQVT